MGTPRQTTSIRCGYYIDTSNTKFRQISHHFRQLFQSYIDGQKMHVISMHFFRCHFDGWKIHVISTYSFQYNINGQKIHVISTFFFQGNLSGRNMHVVFTLFYVILMGKNSTSFLISCKLMKTFKKVFPVFVSLNS